MDLRLKFMCFQNIVHLYAYMAQSVIHWTSVSLHMISACYLTLPRRWVIDLCTETYSARDQNGSTDFGYERKWKQGGS